MDSTQLVDTGQIVVKALLIGTLLIAAAALIIPGRGARGQAIQKLTVLLAVFVGVLAVLFPQVTTAVANLLGIGRGVDLVLYLLIVLFIGFVLTTTTRLRRVDRDLTLLARRLALLEAEDQAGAEGHRPEGGDRAGD